MGGFILTCLIATLLFCVAGMFYCLYIMAKNVNTRKQQIIITEAIGDYCRKCIWNDVIPEVDFDDMESYNKTLYRLWDWGYTNILPKEKFELIKPYIK